jgi:hypothetical protein
VSARDPESWSKRPLRVALLLNSLTVSRWIHDVIQELRASDIVEVVLVILRQDQAPEPKAPFWRRALRARRQGIYTLYTKLDNLLFRAEPDPFIPTDIQPLLHDVPLLRMTPIITRHSDYFTDAAIEAINAYDLDVAVALGRFRILRGGVLKIARYGVWSYHHGDNSVKRGMPAGFWEVMEGAPVTGAILQILTEDLDGGRVIYRSYSATDARSVVRNRRNCYWKSARFVLRKLRDLYFDGPDTLHDPSGAAPYLTAYSGRLYSIPTNLEMARLLLGLLRRFMRDQFTKLLWLEQWFIAYRLAKPEPAAADLPELILYRFKPLIPARDRFWADPFPVKFGDRYYIFFEECINRRAKGHISVLQLDESGPVGEPVRVLERDYHLSHPFVFEWDGAHYLLPETAQNRTVEVYRAVSFPDKWESAGVLLSNVLAVDATMIQLRDFWCMFVNIGTDRISKRDELHLFFAETPLGPWRPHLRNPVKSDVRSSRPAGRVFFHDGYHYRPSQDCSVSYGSAIVLNRIERLDSEHYIETEVARIQPAWLPTLSGVHTINAAYGLTTIDARMKRPRFSLSELTVKLKKPGRDE